MLKRMVLLEDDEPIKEAFQMIFNASEYELILLENGQKILDKELIPPDLFILDRHISGTDGLDICRFIKKLRFIQRCASHYAFSQSNINQLAQNAGADDAISKPFSLKSLRELVSLHVDR